jgi:hypothetical protein
MLLYLLCPFDLNSTVLMREDVNKKRKVRRK